MKAILIAIFLIGPSAFATTINLSSGSKATIHAGDEAVVTCNGIGGGANRCACVAQRPYGCWEWVLKIDGDQIESGNECHGDNSESGARRDCLKKQADYSQCN